MIDKHNKLTESVLGKLFFLFTNCKATVMGKQDLALMLVPKTLVLNVICYSSIYSEN